uniref:Uncharacterized protein n=1 Tax=Anopheles culicifacies TaxID=139723 RepID=A0A182M1Y0_9DIPT
MLPTSSYSSRAASVASVAGPGIPCTGAPTRPSMVLLVMVPTVLLLLFLPGVVLGDYENTWNSYYEQPCCGGTTNGPFHLRHHGACSFRFAPLFTQSTDHLAKCNIRLPGARHTVSVLNGTNGLPFVREGPFANQGQVAT